MRDDQDLKLKSNLENKKFKELLKKKEIREEKGGGGLEKEIKLEIREKEKKEISKDKLIEKDKISDDDYLSGAQAIYSKRGEEIEKVLEKGLEDIFLNMSAERQREFKIVGEQTVNKINNLLNKTKIKLKEIIGLIKNWLLIIPGVNKFFIEQEVKIKADEIFKLKKFN